LHPVPASHGSVGVPPAGYGGILPPVVSQRDVPTSDRGTASRSNSAKQNVTDSKAL